MIESDSESLSAVARLKPELASTKSLFQDLRKSSEDFGSSLVKTFSRGIVSGRSFQDTLRGLGTVVVDSLLKSALKPAQLGLSSLFEKGFGSLFNATQPFSGGATAGPPLSILPFADGGIVSSPSYFPTGRGLGLMGERGAEAILPLARGPDGKLGVRGGGGAGGRPANITVNIAASDIESFRRSEAQVSAAIARAVARGQRAL
jgi:phage-related minor tail protein